MLLTMVLNVFPAFAALRQLSPQRQSVSIPQTSTLSSEAKLGWILTTKQWISPSQLESVLDQQTQSGRKLGELLLENALISTEQLDVALREQYWRRHGYWVI